MCDCFLYCLIVYRSSFSLSPTSGIRNTSCTFAIEERVLSRFACSTRGEESCVVGEVAVFTECGGEEIGSVNIIAGSILRSSHLSLCLSSKKKFGPGSSLLQITGVKVVEIKKKNAEQGTNRPLAFVGIDEETARSRRRLTGDRSPLIAGSHCCCRNQKCDCRKP